MADTLDSSLLPFKAPTTKPTGSSIDLSDSYTVQIPPLTRFKSFPLSRVHESGVQTPPPREQPIFTSSLPGPTLVDAVPVAETGIWGEFVAEANSFLQWILSTVFLFIPAKLISLVYQAPSTSTIAEFLDKLQKSYFPSFFLPPVLLYAAFYLSSKSLRRKSLRFGFEVMGLVMGAIATGILLFYLSDGGWFVAVCCLVVFFLIFAIVKTLDHFCS